MNEPTPKRRRRWYQFSLRSLMLFMFVCAVGFGWVGKKLEATRREQVAVAEIEKLGGSVWYHEIVGPDWLVLLVRKVQGVFLTDAPVTDAELVHLKRLAGLETLYLDGTQVSDEDLVHLQRLANLELLDLDGTQVTDAGLLHRKALPDLKVLALRSTRVTDTGLVHLKELTGLEDLYLHDTQVTNEGVEKLQKALPNRTTNLKDR